MDMSELGFKVLKYLRDHPWATPSHLNGVWKVRNKRSFWNKILTLLQLKHADDFQTPSVEDLTKLLKLLERNNVITSRRGVWVAKASTSQIGGLQREYTLTLNGQEILQQRS